MKWIKKKLLQFCCITFDDTDDDITESSSDCGEMPKTYVLKTLYRSEWPLKENYDFDGKKCQMSEESTYYPSSTTTTETITTYTNTSESETTDSTDSHIDELCDKLLEIADDLDLLSQYLLKITELANTCDFCEKMEEIADDLDLLAQYLENIDELLKQL